MEQTEETQQREGTLVKLKDGTEGVIFKDELSPVKGKRPVHLVDSEGFELEDENGNPIKKLVSPLNFTEQKID